MKIHSDSVEVLSSGPMNLKMGASISVSNRKKFFQVLAKNMYTDPISSIVREITCNALDATKESGTDKEPVINLTDSYIEFRDYGNSMTKEQFEKIFLNLLESTKDSDNNSIGGWGIGGKCPISYTESYTVTCIRDGYETCYLLSECEEFGMSGSVIKQGPTDRHQGTVVRVPIKWGDRSRFRLAIDKQLSLMKNLKCYLNGSVYEHMTVVEEFDKFYVLKPSSSMGISLGGVMYPLDKDKLDFYQFEFLRERSNIVLKFDVGDLEVTPSRETLVWKDRTIAMVQKSLKSVDNFLKKEFVQKSTKDLRKLLDASRDSYQAYTKSGNPIRIRSGFSSYVQPQELDQLFNNLRIYTYNNHSSKYQTHTRIYGSDTTSYEDIFFCRTKVTGYKKTHNSNKSYVYFFIDKDLQADAVIAKWIERSGGYIEDYVKPYKSVTSRGYNKVSRLKNSEFLVKKVVDSNRSDLLGTSSREEWDDTYVQNVKTIHIYGTTDDRHKLETLHTLGYPTIISALTNHGRFVSNPMLIHVDVFIKSTDFREMLQDICDLSYLYLNNTVMFCNFPKISTLLKDDIVDNFNRFRKVCKKLDLNNYINGLSIFKKELKTLNTYLNIKPSKDVIKLSKSLLEIERFRLLSSYRTSTDTVCGIPCGLPYCSSINKHESLSLIKDFLDLRLRGKKKITK